MDSSTIRRIEEIERLLQSLPKGTLVYKTINGKKQPYLQWYEGGKLKSRYVKIAAREETIEKANRRKELEEELKALKSAGYRLPSESSSDRFRANVITGEALRQMTESVKSFQKRDCYRLLEQYLREGFAGRACLLYGLRRTGKTTLLFQAINDLDEGEKARAAYLKARTNNSIADLDSDLKILWERGFRYVFIDEVTLLNDFIDSASMFSDVYAMMGMKIVLSGTDSLGFWFTLTQELYDRALTIHTTFIPFHEHSRLLGVNDVDEYIRYGGTLRPSELAFDDPDALAFDAAFRDDETTRRYIYTAICGNIQHSLACCKRGAFFRHLRELYETDELTGAINRIIESMNHRFLLSTLVRPFVSHDLGSAAELFRKLPEGEGKTRILDQIDRRTVAKKLMEILKIRDQEDARIGITQAHIAEIKEYLKALDLVVDLPRENLIAEPEEYVVFTQPGMRYCQAQALAHILMKDREFIAFSRKERELACEKILEDVRGRMMEDIVLLETARAFSPNRDVFKLTLSRSEVDMVGYDPKENVCELYEIKHSAKIVTRQYHVLEDEELCREIERRYGKIVGKTVIYRGEDRVLENGIAYRNVEDYLNSLNRR